MLTRRPKKKGFEIVIANDGREGVNKTKTEKPDLILMDLSLPELDGWEATRLIKTDQETSQIPAIALSAHAMKEHIYKALEAGCDDYDTKPVDIKRLLEKISKFLDTRWLNTAQKSWWWMTTKTTAIHSTED